MNDLNLKLLKIVQHVFEITVMLNLNFRLMLCSRVNVKFSYICLNMFEGIKLLKL